MLLATIVIIALVLLILFTLNRTLPFFMIVLGKDIYTISIWYRKNPHILSILRGQWLRCQDWVDGSFTYLGKRYIINNASPIWHLKK